MPNTVAIPIDVIIAMKGAIRHLRSFP